MPVLSKSKILGIIVPRTFAATTDDVCLVARCIPCIRTEHTIVIDIDTLMMVNMIIMMTMTMNYDE